MMDSAVVAGKFDETGSETIRFIHEASNRTDDLYVALLSDELVEQIYGSPPRHTLAERKYFVANIRYVDGVCAVDDLEQLGAEARLFDPLQLIQKELRLGTDFAQVNLLFLKEA